MKRDEAVERGVHVYDHYKPWWHGRSGHRAVRKALEWMYEHRAPADAHTVRNGRGRTVRTALGQNRSLLTFIMAGAVSATGSAAVTTNANGWIATAIAWGTSIMAVLIAGVRSWLRG